MFLITWNIETTSLGDIYIVFSCWQNCWTSEEFICVLRILHISYYLLIMIFPSIHNTIGDTWNASAWLFDLIFASLRLAVYYIVEQFRRSTQGHCSISIEIQFTTRVRATTEVTFASYYFNLWSKQVSQWDVGPFEKASGEFGWHR